MYGRMLTLNTLLLLLTGCRQEQLTLPVTHAAGIRPQPGKVVSRARRKGEPEPGSSCFAYIPLRPRGQRARAVQERLRQADEMAAAFDARTVTVDLVGDHANILSLEAPVPWPPPPLYAERLSAILEDYFSKAEVEDNLCNAGFAEVKLSLRGLNDRRVHPLWKARVTSEGLLKLEPDGSEQATLLVR